MRPLPRDLQLPKLRAQASIVPQTLNEKSRTVEVIFYSGASVQRYPFFDDPYELSFDLSAKAVRLERFNAGAPLVDNHRDDMPVMQATLGVVEKAWLEKDGGHAVVKIAADRPDILARIQDGILRNFSMGAVVHQMKDITEKGDTQRRLLAIDWEPHELSIVPVPADMGAQALAQQLEQAEKFPCRLTSGAASAHKETTMKIQVRLLADVEELGVTGDIVEIEKTEFDKSIHSEDLDLEDDEPEQRPAKRKPKAGAKADDPKAAKLAVDDALERKQKLEAEVKRIAAAYGLDAVWARRQINLNTPIEDVLELAAEERAKRAPRDVNEIGVGDDFESLHWRSEQMASALAARAQRKEIPEPAKQYAHYGFVDLAYEVLGALRMARGVDIRNRARVIELALSTSDFPNLLANAGNKVLMPAYLAAEQTFKRLCIEQDVADFKSVSILNTGDFPAPLAVGENGEIKLGYFAEQKNTVALASYGRRLAFSRQMLINDDLASFGRVLAAYGVRVSDYQNGAFFTLLSTVGPTLGDGGAMFNATALTTAGGHANYTSSGTAISDASITVGAALMAAQTGIGSDNLGDGVKLNVQPKYLLAAPGKRNLAFQYTSAAYTPSAPTSINSWAGVLMPVLDANLSGNRWWLFADPALFPCFAYGSLAGSPGPRVATRPGFEVEGVEMRVAFDFYVGGIDWRGGYCNAGA